MLTLTVEAVIVAKSTEGESKMIIDQLKKLMEDGQFHHATYRYDFARGWHIYAKEGYSKKLAFRGFEYVGSFSEYNKELCEEVRKLVRGTGYSVGSYGNG